MSQALGEEYVGLVEVDDGEWDVYFGPLRISGAHRGAHRNSLRSVRQPSPGG